MAPHARAPANSNSVVRRSSCAAYYCGGKAYHYSVRCWRPWLQQQQRHSVHEHCCGGKASSVRRQPRSKEPAQLQQRNHQHSGALHNFIRRESVFGAGGRGHMNMWHSCCGFTAQSLRWEGVLSALAAQAEEVDVPVVHYRVQHGHVAAGRLCARHRSGTGESDARDAHPAQRITSLESCTYRGSVPWMREGSRRLQRPQGFCDLWVLPLDSPMCAAVCAVCATL